MEECYYSYKIFWHYFQLTKNGYFQILGKRRSQWKVIVKWKCTPDPIKRCKIYKTTGCTHVDGYLCNISECEKYDKILNTNNKD